MSLFGGKFSPRKPPPPPPPPPSQYYCPQCGKLILTEEINKWYTYKYRKGNENFLNDKCIFDNDCKSILKNKGITIDENYNIITEREYYYYQYVHDTSLFELYKELDFKCDPGFLYTLVYTKEKGKSKNVGFAIIDNNKDFVTMELLPEYEFTRSHFMAIIIRKSKKYYLILKGLGIEYECSDIRESFFDKFSKSGKKTNIILEKSDENITVNEFICFIRYNNNMMNKTDKYGEYLKYSFENDERYSLVASVYLRGKKIIFSDEYGNHNLDNIKQLMDFFEYDCPKKSILEPKYSCEDIYENIYLPVRRIELRTDGIYFIQVK